MAKQWEDFLFVSLFGQSKEEQKKNISRHFINLLYFFKFSKTYKFNSPLFFFLLFNFLKFYYIKPGVRNKEEKSFVRDVLFNLFKRLCFLKTNTLVNDCANIFLFMWDLFLEGRIICISATESPGLFTMFKAAYLDTQSIFFN